MRREAGRCSQSLSLLYFSSLFTHLVACFLEVKRLIKRKIVFYVCVHRCNVLKLASAVDQDIQDIQLQLCV